MPAPNLVDAKGAMAGGKDFIKKMHLKKGALHRALGVPEDQDIPDDKMREAANSQDPHVRRMAHTGMMLKGLHGGEKKKHRSGKEKMKALYGAAAG